MKGVQKVEKVLFRYFYLVHQKKDLKVIFLAEDGISPNIADLFLIRRSTLKYRKTLPDLQKPDCVISHPWLDSRFCILK